MTSDESIVDFLCREENLSLAIEVADAMSAVELRVEQRFVSLMKARVTERFKTSKLPDDWRLVTEIDPIKKSYRWAGVFMLPLETNAPHLYYSLTIYRSPSEYYIYYGLDWGTDSEEQPKGFPNEESAALVEFLKEGSFSSSRYTLGWKVVSSFTNRKELLLALHNRSEELSTSAVSDFWAFVASTVDNVVATNASLGRPLKKK